jgi:hypothetical protein
MIETHPSSLDIDQDTSEKVVDVGKSKPLRLPGQQQALYNALLEKDQGLTNMYYGALMVLNHNSNPDNLALAAHGVRELMEKIPVFVDVQIKAQTESLKGKVLDLENFWTATLRKTKCYKSQKWSGQIDVPLSKLLERLYTFFEWFIKHHPRRRAEIIATLQGLDSSRFKLPEHLEKLNAQTWDDMRDFFQAVSHHRKFTTGEEFSLRLNMLETFLLDRLHPRTFADINVIDEIIREGESDA